MNPTLRVLLVAALGLLSANAFGAVADIDLTAATEAPDSMRDLAYMLIYGISMCVVLGLTVWAIFKAREGNYKPIGILYFSIFLISISLTLYFRGNGVWSYNFINNFASTYSWQVYGQNQASLTNFPSQQFGYEHERGWALAGAVWYYRAMKFGYESLLIPMFLFASVLWAVWKAKENESFRPLISHMLVMIVVFPLIMLPTIKLEAPGDNNIMFAWIAGTANQDTDQVRDEPVISPFMAATFGVTTELAEKLGERLSFGDRTPGAIVAQAGLDARMADGDLDSYQEYSSYCMTAVKNAMNQRPSLQQESPYAQWYIDLMGNTSAPAPDGAVGEYARAPQHLKYALSPYADKLFKDVFISEWVPQSLADSGLDRFRGAQFVLNYPGPYAYHENPFIGSGKIGTYDEWREKGSGNIGIPNRHKWEFLFPMVQSFRELEMYYTHAGVRYLPYCSLTGLNGNYETLRELADDARFPDNFAHLNQDERAGFRPFPLGDGLRTRLSKRYLGDDGIEFCKGVSPDRQNQHFWGCLIAGRYNVVPANDRERTMLSYQQAFDNVVRPMIQAEVDRGYNDVGGDTGGAVQRSPGSRIYYRSGVFTLGGTETNLLAVRDFTDLYFAAPGIQAQIGLTGDYRGNKSDEKVNSDNWFLDFIQSLAGILKPGIAGLFSAIGTIMAKICLMIYPHVLGLMTFVMMLVAFPYAIRAGWYGQAFIMLSWAAGVVVIALMHVIIQFGLSFIETGNGLALPAFFIRASAGGEFGESLLRIVGSFFVVSAYSIAMAFMSFGMGGIAALLANVNRVGFQLTGAGVAGTLTLAGLAASAALKGGALMALSQKLVSAGKDVAGAASKEGGNVGPDGGKPGIGGPGNVPGLPGPTGAGTSGGGTGGAGGSGGGSAGRAGGPASSAVATGPAKGTPGYSQRTTLRTRDLSDSDQATTAQRETAVAQMLDHSSSAVSATTGLALSTFQAGAVMADQSGGLAQGGQTGSATAGKAFDATMSGARSAMAAGKGAAGFLRDKYRNRRRDNGELNPTIRADDGDADGFARAAQTFEYDANTAKDAGNGDAERVASLKGGDAFRDASVLAETPTRSGSYALQSAGLYRRAGDFSAAENMLRQAQTRFKAGERTATNDLERGDALLGQASVAQAALELQEAQSAKTGEAPPSNYQREQVSRQVSDLADTAQVHFKRITDPTAAAASASGTAPTWTAYASPLLGRVRAAVASDRSGGDGPRAVVTVAGRELAETAAGGDRNASAVLGAIQATGGFDQQAQDTLRQAGLNLSAEDYLNLQADLRAGRYSALEALLRKKG